MAPPELQNQEVMNEPLQVALPPQHPLCGQAQIALGALRAERFLLHSALLGMLSGGLSGFSLNHSDTGGYTTISHPLKDYHRDEELLLRWMEFSAFTSLLRSHEGNRPDANQQIYSSQKLLAQFARSAKIFAALAPYRQQLMEEAARSGMPLMRPLWLQYPDDPAGQQALPRSFLLGDQLLVAPVLEPGIDELEVLLPAGNWVHVWSGKVMRVRAGESVRVSVPMGQPAVFYPEGAAMAATGSPLATTALKRRAPSRCSFNPFSSTNSRMARR